MHGGHPRAGVALDGRPRFERPDTVAQVHKNRLGLPVGGVHEPVGFVERLLNARQGLFVKPLRHRRALLLVDEVEEHVPAKVVDGRVVERRDQEPFVVEAVFAGDGLDVGHERAHPCAHPHEAEERVERDVRHPRHAVFGQIPEPHEVVGVGLAHKPGGCRVQHIVDRQIGVEVGGAEHVRVRPVGRGLRVHQPAERADGVDAEVAHRVEFAAQLARERHADERLDVGPAAHGVRHLRVDALVAVVRQLRRFFGVEVVVEDGAGNRRLGRVVRVGVRQLVAAHEQAGRLERHAVAHRFEEVVVFDLERLHPEDDLKARVRLGGGVVDEPEPARSAPGSGLGDFFVAAPLADEERPAVAPDVQAGGVLEARAGVVRPDAQVGEIRHGRHQVAHLLAVVVLRHRVILREDVARNVRAERVVDARAAQRGVAGEELLRQRARLKRAHARLEAEGAPSGGQLLHPVEVGREVLVRVDAPRERRVHKLAQARRVGVELVVVLGLHARLEGEALGKAVDLEVRKAASGVDLRRAAHRLASRGALVLGEGAVEKRTVEREDRLQREAAGERCRLVGRKLAVSEQVGEGVEHRRRGR